uniref:COP9 signalosome complex subunit 9 n=1 Tax=Sus scrofa TaxID=9823 RepID=A0A8D1FMU9_PIG
MKPAVDEMFPEGAGPYVDLDEAGGSTGLLMDLAANEKAVHADFFNGKDAGWAASFSPCFLCKGCRGAVLGRERLGPQARQAQVPCPSGNSARSLSNGQLCVKRRSSCSQVPSVGSEPGLSRAPAFRRRRCSQGLSVWPPRLPPLPDGRSAFLSPFAVRRVPLAACGRDSHPPALSCSPLDPQPCPQGQFPEHGCSCTK